MKKQILLNQTVEGCCPTVTAGYYKYGVATLMTGNFGTTGGAVLEIEEMSDTNKIINVGQYDSSQNSRIVSSEGISYAVTNGHKDGMPKIIQEAINTDANGNAKAIRACYGQCGYDSVFRGTGQGITGVMEEVEPKIVGYSRSSEGSGKIVGRHLNDYANTITCSTGSGNTTDMYVAEPRIMQLVGDRGNPSVSVKDIAFTVCSSPMSDRGKLLSSQRLLQVVDVVRVGSNNLK